MKTIQEALTSMLPAFRPVGQQRSGLLEALGLHLAESLKARTSLPPFSNSAMDGYAVRSSDVTDASSEQPKRLAVVGECRAGGPLAQGPTPPGSAWRIFTGANMPPGADAVVIQEDTRALDAGVEVFRPVGSGANVRHLGSDVLAGDVMLEAGAGRAGPSRRPEGWCRDDLPPAPRGPPVHG